MRHRNIVGWSSLVLLAGLVRLAAAGEGIAPCQNCHAGDGCYREVVTHRCVLVPDRKPIKKTVYECKDVPYCEHRLPKFGHCDCCPECAACPKYRRVLIKREIVVGEICTTKCVVEEVIERVPAPCCHCGHVPYGDGNGSAQEIPGAPAPPTPTPDARSVWLPPTPESVAPSLVR